MSLTRAAGIMGLKRDQLTLKTADIFSPLATPADSLDMQHGYPLSSAAEYCDVYLASYDYHFSNNITQFAIPEYNDYANTVDDVFATSYDPSKEQEVEFSNYLEI